MSFLLSRPYAHARNLLSAHRRLRRLRKVGAAQGVRFRRPNARPAKAVDSHNAEALALLERIVNINSGTMNFAGVRAVADVLRPQLESLGFRTSWVDGASFKRAGHLIAEHPAPGPKILLIGHLDTVFEPSSPFQKFIRLDDSTATGPGVIDMKGGDVVMLFALRALKDAGQLDRMNVTAVFDGDEEDAGRPLASARQRAHRCRGGRERRAWDSRTARATRGPR